MPTLLAIKNKTQEAGAYEAQSLLVYGQAEVGKTLTVGKLAANPFFKKVIWLDVENGHRVLYQLPDEVLAKIELYQIRDTAKNPIAIRSLMMAFTEEVELCKAHGAIRSKCTACTRNKEAEFYKLNLPAEPESTLLVVDSLTQTSSSAIAHAQGKSTKANILDLDLADEKATFNHYGGQGFYLDRMLTDWQNNLTCSRVMITHELNIAKEDKKESLAPICGTKNFSRKVGRFFDHTVRLFKLNGAHIGESRSTAKGGFKAASRSNANVMVDGKVDLFECFSYHEAEEEVPTPVVSNNKPASPPTKMAGTKAKTKLQLKRK